MEQRDAPMMTPSHPPNFASDQKEKEKSNILMFPLELYKKLFSYLNKTGFRPVS
jgi:hypothetical protein